MRKIVVTGVNGFIGKHVAFNLLNRGIIVYGVDIDGSQFEQFSNFKNFVKVVASFEEYDKLPHLIKDDIDVFYHFAWAGGFTSAVSEYDIQLKNAKYSADAAKNALLMHCKKFVYAGTYNEFEIITGFLSDGFEPRKTCIYSSSKLAADIICRAIACLGKMEYCSALIPMPYGEGNHSKQLVNIVIAQLLRGIAPKLIEGNNLYDLVYIEDIAEAFYYIGLLGKDKQKYYIGHRQIKTFKQNISLIRDCIAPNVDLTFGEFQDNHEIDYGLIDLDALYRDTGFECKADFNKTIKKTAEWIKNNFEM